MGHPLTDYPLKTPTKLRTIIIKVNDAEKNAIQKKADLHTQGNVSQLLRKAAISFEPKEGDKPKAV